MIPNPTHPGEDDSFVCRLSSADVDGNIYGGGDRHGEGVGDG